jgi:hypothetical protein
MLQKFDFLKLPEVWLCGSGGLLDPCSSEIMTGRSWQIQSTKVLKCVKGKKSDRVISNRLQKAFKRTKESMACVCLKPNLSTDLII